MKINVPVKWKDEASIDENEALTRRVLNLDERGSDVVFSEGFLTIDTDDIRNWNAAEDNCVTVRTHQADAYIVAVPFEEFNALWTQVTGETIMQIRVREKKSRKTLK